MMSVEQVQTALSKSTRGEPSCHKNSTSVGKLILLNVNDSNPTLGTGIVNGLSHFDQ